MKKNPAKIFNIIGIVIGIVIIIFGFNFIGSDYINPGHGVRSWGCSVRLVKDAVK